MYIKLERMVWNVQLSKYMITDNAQQFIQQQRDKYVVVSITLSINHSQIFKGAKTVKHLKKLITLPIYKINYIDQK